MTSVARALCRKDDLVPHMRGQSGYHFDIREIRRESGLWSGLPRAVAPGSLFYTRTPTHYSHVRTRLDPSPQPHSDSAPSKSAMFFQVCYNESETK